VLLFLAGGRENDARHGAPPIVGAHRGQHIQSAQMGHHQIEKDETDVGFALEGLERFTTVVCKRDAKRALLELHFDDAANMRFVIGNQHVVDRRGAGHDRSDESRDVFSIAAQLEEQLTDIRTRGDEDEEYRVVGEHRDDREALRMFQDSGEQRSAMTSRHPNSLPDAMIAGTRAAISSASSPGSIWLSINRPS
jgi:hypothetical protein